jgi:hypothetical protein
MGLLLSLEFSKGKPSKFGFLERRSGTLRHLQPGTAHSISTRTVRGGSQLLAGGCGLICTALHRSLRRGWRSTRPTTPPCWRSQRAWGSTSSRRSSQVRVRVSFVVRKLHGLSHGPRSDLISAFRRIFPIRAARGHRAPTGHAVRQVLLQPRSHPLQVRELASRQLLAPHEVPHAFQPRHLPSRREGQAEWLVRPPACPPLLCCCSPLVGPPPGASAPLLCVRAIPGLTQTL